MPTRRDVSAQGPTTPDFSDLQKRLIIASLLMASVFLVGVTGYRMLGAGETWIDALYMTANVLTTAGFREAVSTERNAGAETFTVFLLLFGAGTVVYFTSVMTAFVVEGDLTQTFRRRRMTRTLREMADHYIVCGCGNAGRAVLSELTSTRRAIVAIEADAERARRAEVDYPDVPVLVGDATSDEIMLQAGATRARGVIVCLDDDRDSLVATVTARQLNPNGRIVARATDERGCARIRAAGADAVIAPSQIGGLRMASEMVRPSVVGFLDKMLRDKQQNLRIEEIEIPSGSPFAGKRLGDIDFRATGNLLLLAVHQPKGGDYVHNPAPDHRVDVGSQLIVMGDPTGVERMRARAKAGSG